eukprot:COSAG01_NODE_2540_length_7478_cov_13.257759_4_plen_99_part_00
MEGGATKAAQPRPPPLKQGPHTRARGASYCHVLVSVPRRHIINMGHSDPKYGQKYGEDRYRTAVRLNYSTVQYCTAVLLYRTAVRLYYSPYFPKEPPI